MIRIVIAFWLGWLPFMGYAQDSNFPTSYSVERMVKDASQLAPGVRKSFDEALQTGGVLYRSSLQPSYHQGLGFGIRYCFEYEYLEDQPVYATVKTLVLAYKSIHHWKTWPEFNEKGLCISSQPDLLSGPNDEVRRSRSFEELAKEAENLCSYLAENLQGIKRPPTVSALPVNPPDIRDPEEPGAYDVYVLRRPDAGRHAQLARTDRRLHFSPRWEEWKALLLALLDVDPTSQDGKSFSGIESAVPGFPLLSRIAGPHTSAVYRPMEVSELRAECNRAMKQAQDDPLARSGLDKILRATRWAEALDSGLLFQAD